jgi:uncharacterized protein
VRFWDSSALIPLFVVEPSTALVRGWLDEDADVVVWALTRVELVSAIARRRRERRELASRLASARRNALAASERWLEVTAIDAVRSRAERVVELHPLRAAHALQIAAALVAARDDPGAFEFVTLDDRQAEAAEREGFRVLGPR